MTLYYNKDSYEIRDLEDSLIDGWINDNNPKINQWQQLPPRPSNLHVWSNGSWIQQEIMVPEYVTATQIRLWLFNHNISLSTIDSQIEAIPDQSLKEITKIQWEYGIEIGRNHPILPVISQILNLSQQDLDLLFIEAQSL